MTVLDDVDGCTVNLTDHQEPCPVCETPMRVVVLTIDGFWGVRVIAHSHDKQRCSGDSITLRKGRVR